MLSTASSYPSALNYYFRAYAADQTNAMAVFSIALAYLQYAMKRQAENRHYLALQGVGFFDEYRRLRLGTNKRKGKGEGVGVAEGRGLEPEVERQRKMEVEFNEGRMWHLLGLLHLAVPAYERCLAVEELPKGTEGGGDGDVDMGGADTPIGNGEKQEEADFKREAAYALQIIFAQGGDVVKARMVTEEWLVY